MAGTTPFGIGGRRQFLFGLGGTCLTALPVARAGAQDRPVSLPMPSSASLSTRTDANTLLTVAVSVNEQGPFQFIVDTGSERTILADTLAARLGVGLGDPVIVSGLARQVSAAVAIVKELKYGPFVKTDLEAPILPYRAVGADGILGLDAIRNSRVEFDFKTHLLRVDRANAPMTDDDPSIQTVVVRARGNGGRLRMSDCRVDGVEAQTFVDTGAEISVCNRALYQALLRHNPKLKSLGEAVLTGVTGGEIRGPAIPTQRIELQSIVFNGGSVVAADVDDFSLWGLTDRPALLIGMDFLRQFAAVTVDFRSREVTFGLSQDGPSHH